MKRSSKLSLVTEKPETMHSPLALTFDAEIKRMTLEKGIAIGHVMAKLAAGTGITERHLYNYRSGKTDIPGCEIPILCKHFESNALAMALVGMCDVGEFDAQDAFDLADFCAASVSEMLAGGRVFIEAARDGTIDGHELIQIKNVVAMIVRNAHRTLEVATQMRERRVA
ncbi:MAG TPA: hypothetical protein VGO43_09790 [Pyrinomonadaceae bacterium]|nr:hypothetical protein [Pyrinomonadaceae bacterium]